MAFVPAALLSDLNKLRTDGPKPAPASKRSSAARKGFAPSATSADPLTEYNSTATLDAIPTGGGSPSNRPSTNVAVATQPPRSRSPAYTATSTRSGARQITPASRQRSPEGRGRQRSPNRQRSPTSGGEVPDVNDELAFVYEADEDVSRVQPAGKTNLLSDTRSMRSVQSLGGGKGRDESGRRVSVNPEKMHMVSLAQSTSSLDSDVSHLSGATMRPTTRKDVALLKHTAEKLIKEIGAEVDQPYPTEMHAFLAIITEEQKIYDAVFQELIRQVTVNMIERGEVLAEIRNRYANMFTKIPKHVKHLHTELLAQRKLNRRLTQELLRSKEMVTEMVKELEIIRKHDYEVTKQAQDAHEKLSTVLTQSDNTGEILEEYHKLYRMQRDRLEEAVRQAEQEKRVWIDAATSLALRIGQEHGFAELMLLQKYEHRRMRATSHIIVTISTTHDVHLRSVEKKIDEWRKKLIKLSQTVVEEDRHNIDVLAKMQRDMELVLKNLDVSEPTEAIEAEHPLLKVFHVHDVKSIADHLRKWVDQITTVATRFTSDKDLAFQEDITQIRKETNVWVEEGYRLLHRNERNTNGKEYEPLTELLGRIAIEVRDWLDKLMLRVTGEDGIAGNMISLQNQLEDRYTTYGARDVEKPLASSERTTLMETLTAWSLQIKNNLIETLSDTTEKEQHKIPLHVENFLSRLMDQLNTDSDIRNEENMKLHTSLISWMINLLVQGGSVSVRPDETWDHAYTLLETELQAFNTNLLRDAQDINTLTEQGVELRDLVLAHCHSWTQVAKRLLANEKRMAMERWSKPKKPLSLLINELKDDYLEMPSADPSLSL